jgi:hypothetical protein
VTNVRFDSGPDQHGVPVGIYDHDLALVDRVLGSEPVVLEHGSYFAVGRGPDGREVRENFSVGSQPTKVRVGLEPSTPGLAYLDFVPSSGVARRVSAAVRFVRRFDQPTVTEYESIGPGEWKLVQRRQAWRLGQADLDQITCDALVLGRQGSHPICLRLPRQGRRYFVISLRWTDADEASLDVRLANEQADALLRYLDRGEIGAAALLAQSPALSAETLLGDKLKDPVAAAAGAYGLLRLGDLDRLHSWTRNLSEWFEWFPDGAVVYAEHMAQLGEHELAIRALKSLATRGLPCFSVGLGLAADRLRAYTRLRPDDEHLRVSLEDLTRFAVATDFSQPVTVFACTAPDAPLAPGPDAGSSAVRQFLRRVLPSEQMDESGRSVFRWRFKAPTRLFTRLGTSRKEVSMDSARFVFAVVVTIVFLVASALLVANADTTNQSEWERLVYVFGAIEAIAFAAVGWVFGKEVNRQRADNAEKRAEDAEKEKVTEKEKGRILAGMVVGGGGAEGRERLEAQGAGGGNRAAVEYAKRAYDI